MENKRAAGILLHPSSLPSPHGIGDLGPSAYAFIDFLQQAGLGLWQVLPLGPTGYGDSPYQCFSAFAGNPALLSLTQLVEDGLLTQTEVDALPALPANTANPDGAMALKLPLLQKAFARFHPGADYDCFCQQSAFWLPDYALFRAIKDHLYTLRQTGEKDASYRDFVQSTAGRLTAEQIDDQYFGALWYSWPKALVHRQTAALKAMMDKLSQAIAFQTFLQYLFFRQWANVKAYANAAKIRIIGDLPIFVSLDSADAWSRQELFLLDEDGFPAKVAGVPPDYFSPTGQLWGNPVYRWQTHQKDGFAWWIERIRTQLRLADLLRIDHFRGFKSNYQIPFGSQTAQTGSWHPGPGKALFDAVKTALGSLPLLAEDLGIITPQVEALRLSCGLPGMKVLQFAFGDTAQNPYLPHNYEKNCIVYTGTHDNDTSIGWYQTVSEKEKDYFRRYTSSSGASPGWDLIRLAMASTADTAIFPLQDVLCLDGSARMNTPGRLGGNWHWRFSMAQLLPSYAHDLHGLAELFGRLAPPKNSPTDSSSEPSDVSPENKP